MIVTGRGKCLLQSKHEGWSMSASSQDHLSEQIPVIHCEPTVFPPLPLFLFSFFCRTDSCPDLLFYCSHWELWVNNPSINHLLFFLAALKDLKVMKLNSKQKKCVISIQKVKKLQNGVTLTKTNYPLIFHGFVHLLKIKVSNCGISKAM